MKIHNLDPQKEREFEKLREDGLRLHVPITEQLWKLEVFDKDGLPVETMHKRAESWVRNAYNMLFSIMATKGATGTGYGAGSLQMRRTDGTTNVSTTGVNEHSNNPGSTDSAGSYGFRANAGIVTYGILVGSSSAAESFEHHSIQTLITNGTGAGQLSYTETDAPVMTYVAETRILSVDWRRFFNNNSGGDIVVRELAAVRYYTPVAGGLYYLLSRDLLSSAITIPNAGQLKVTYAFRITYPA